MCGSPARKPSRTRTHTVPSNHELNRPPIIVTDGPPLPVGAKPPLPVPPPLGSPEEELGSEEEIQNEDCGVVLVAFPTAYPKPTDLPPWASPVGSPGNPPKQGKSCAWTAGNWRDSVGVALFTGAASFQIEPLGVVVDSPYAYDFSGAQVQLYSPVVTSWSCVLQPGSSLPPAAASFINFVVPASPKPGKCSVWLLPHPVHHLG